MLAVASIALFQLQLAVGTSAGAATNDSCNGAFQGSPAGSLSLSAVPGPGSISAGQTITITATWNTGDWSGLDQFSDCFEVNGALDPSLTYEDKPPANDGYDQHSVDVPKDLVDGDTFCVRARLSGQPTGGNTSTQKSNTLCWTIGSTPKDPDVKVAKSASKTSVSSGDSLTFTLEASNVGTATATSVAIVDTIPAGFTITGASAGCGINGQKVTCDVGDIDAGKSKSVTIDVKATDAACPKVDNQATVSASNEPAGNTGNNTSNTVTVDVTCPNPDVKIAKSASSTSIKSGDTVTFTLEASNVGSGAATNVVIADTIPRGLTITSAPGCTISGQNVSCNVGDIAGGGKKSVTITVKATDGACPSVDNKATVSASNEPSGNTGNNTSNTVTLKVTCPNPDVKVTKSSDAPTTGVKPGDSFTYTIKVTNVGGTTATGVKVSDTIPSSLTITSAPGCSISGQKVTCDLGDIGAGASKSVTITVKATEGSCPAVVNRATVTASNEPTAATGNNTSNDVSTSVNCTVVVEPGLAIRIVKTNDASGDGDYSDDEEAPRPDKDVQFLLVITNTGDADARITDLTDSFGGQTIDLLGGKCAQLKGVSLASGESVTCTFTLNSYSPPHGSPLTNTAEVCVENMDGSKTDCDRDPSTVRSAEVLGATVTPTKTPPGGVAFTGSDGTLGAGLAGLALLLLGSGLVWFGYRRRARYEG